MDYHCQREHTTHHIRLLESLHFCPTDVLPPVWDLLAEMASLGNSAGDQGSWCGGQDGHQTQGRIAWLGLCPWSLVQAAVPEGLGRSSTGLLCPIRGAGSGPYLPGCQCAGPQPGSLAGADTALLAVSTGRIMEAWAARRAASILDPKGRGGGLGT